ncbi:two component sensor kinase [Bordetella ansorpii]|uniref:histidine kinase n=1 Tax=Bordetella ansorpii TaxID=288768 RepID=A0A157S7L9_9BORD|nr:ATP-binding protein [Bordetella ansorpii]SAI66261.1 two component sensor kinase [Bordetella ansorpii]
MWLAKSLRARVLLGILTVLMISWLLQFSLYWESVTREQSGVRDHGLRSVVGSLAFFLEFVPAMQEIGSKRPAPDFLLHQAGSYAEFQIWDLFAGRLVLASRAAPKGRLSPADIAGFATVQVDGELWRVYSGLDPSARFEIVAGTPVQQFNEQLTKRFRLGALVTLLMFMGIGGVTVLVVRRSLRTLSHIGADISMRGAGDHSDLDESRVPKEIKPLIRAINARQRKVCALMMNERRFIGDAAHELRTPLAVLAVYADTAYRTHDHEKTKLLLKKISDTTRRSSRIVEQLLDLARMEGDQSEVRFSLVDLSAVIDLVVSDMQSAFDERDQRVIVDARPCCVHGQIDALGTLVRNLVDNAGRYSGMGSTINVRIAQTGGAVVLTVNDNGPGIDPRERERIFDPFYRVPGAGSHGSGIGLALVWRIARHHRATVTVVEGFGGRGVRFDVTFPTLTVP